MGRNIFTGIHRNATAHTGKDAVYRFLSAHRHNWRRLMGFLSQMVIKGFLEPLTETKRDKVLTLDTTIYDRSRSSKVELLSKVYDHCAKRYLNGFRMLTLGWSDGATFVPCDHAILCPTSITFAHWRQLHLCMLIINSLFLMLEQGRLNHHL